MQYTRIKKNGIKIQVKDWSNTITLIDKKTNKVIGEKSFKDHIVAVYLAKKL